jgi:rod shape-determining protein MreC
MSLERRTQARPTGLFVTLCAAMLLLAMVSQQPWAAGPRSYAKGTLAPLEAAMMVASDRVGAFAAVFGDNAQLRAENQSLQAQNAELRRQIAELQAAGQDNIALRQALDFQRAYGHATMTAQVVGRGPDGFSLTVEIDRGTADGVRPGMVVASGAGLVGRVLEAAPHAAIVQTLADPQSRVSGYLAQSGVEGTVMGGAGNLQMQINPRFGAVPSKGDWVMTSGVGGGYPRGLVIGKLASVSYNAASTVDGATVAWVNDPASLTVVLVITDFTGS